jgi:hypothetical protein
MTLHPPPKEEKCNATLQIKTFYKNYDFLFVLGSTEIYSSSSMLWSLVSALTAVQLKMALADSYVFVRCPASCSALIYWNQAKNSHGPPPPLYLSFVPVLPLIYPHSSTPTGWITHSTLALGMECQQVGLNGSVGGQILPSWQLLSPLSMRILWLAEL